MHLKKTTFYDVVYGRPYVRSHFCSLKAYFSLHYCIISNFNFQYFFRTSMPLLFIFLPIVYALTFKVVHTNVQTLLDVRLVGTLRTCEVPGLKLIRKHICLDIIEIFENFICTTGWMHCSHFLQIPCEIIL